MMKNESGRSMVEMLGVLAIIGVLSVGGIAGYTMAMNKYKANEIAATATQCGMLAIAKASTQGTDAASLTCLGSNGYGLDTPTGVSTMTATATATGTAVVTTVLTDTTGGLQAAFNALKGNHNGITLS